MNSDDPKQKKPATPPTDHGLHLPHSGSGASTALVAMLKKRQMRPNRDVEVLPPNGSTKKAAGE